MSSKKSVKKRERQNTKRSVRNLSKKRSVKSLIKEVETLVSKNKQKEAEKLVPKAYKAIDKAAKKNIIKKNTAARKKSRVAKLAKKVSEK